MYSVTSCSTWSSKWFYFCLRDCRNIFRTFRRLVRACRTQDVTSKLHCKIKCLSSQTLLLFKADIVCIFYMYDTSFLSQHICVLSVLHPSCVRNRPTHSAESFPAVFSHGLTRKIAELPKDFTRGLAGKVPVKCVEQLNQTFAFSHTATPENYMV